MAGNILTNMGGAWLKKRGRLYFEEQQAKANSLKLRHMITVSYPEIKHINRHEETLELLDIADASERYAPAS